MSQRKSFPMVLKKATDEPSEHSKDGATTIRTLSWLTLPPPTVNYGDLQQEL